MGNTPFFRKINFEDMKLVLRNPEAYILINTLPIQEQQCLLPFTIPCGEEEQRINQFLQEKRKTISIILYGKHSNDETLFRKYDQLIKLGFTNVYMYCGGLFEWLLLQDIYGREDFPTTTKELELLKYKPNAILTTQLLEYR